LSSFLSVEFKNSDSCSENVSSSIGIAQIGVSVVGTCEGV